MQIILLALSPMFSILLARSLWWSYFCPIRVTLDWDRLGIAFAGTCETWCSGVDLVNWLYIRGCRLNRLTVLGIFFFYVCWQASSPRFEEFVPLHTILINKRCSVIDSKIGSSSGAEVRKCTSPVFQSFME